MFEEHSEKVQKVQNKTKFVFFTFSTQSLNDQSMAKFHKNDQRMSIEKFCSEQVIGNGEGIF